MKTILETAGTCSWFGGPNDAGVTESEGLALIQPAESTDAFFRPLFQRDLDGRKGLARQLNPLAHFCAMRWDYSIISRHALRYCIVRVENRAGAVVWCRPADWGPNTRTGRVIDLSWGAMVALKITTDDTVSIRLLA